MGGGVDGVLEGNWVLKAGLSKGGAEAEFGYVFHNFAFGDGGGHGQPIWGFKTVGSGGAGG